MNFNFNKEKIINDVKKLGGKVKVDSSNPGVFVENEGTQKPLTMDDIFPELHPAEKIHEENLLGNVTIELESDTHYRILNVKTTFSQNELVGAA